MSERTKAEVLVTDGLTGTIYDLIVGAIDWDRILLEASGRHLTLDHPTSTVYGELCGECIEAALLDRPNDEG